MTPTKCEMTRGTDDKNRGGDVTGTTPRDRAREGKADRGKKDRDDPINQDRNERHIRVGVRSSS